MDFRAPAEMFTGRQSAEGRAHPYRRFETLALAIQYAIEQQPSALVCTVIETEHGRLDDKQIRAAYESADFRAAIDA